MKGSIFLLSRTLFAKKRFYEGKEENLQKTKNTTVWAERWVKGGQKREGGRDGGGGGKN